MYLVIYSVVDVSRSERHTNFENSAAFLCGELPQRRTSAWRDSSKAERGGYNLING
jgi:hypothetical protein